MFTIDKTLDTVKHGTITMADAIQKSKKQFVKTMVTNDAYAKTMNDFVDAQAEYTNNAINAGFESAKKMLNTTSDMFKESMQMVQNVTKKSK